MRPSQRGMEDRQSQREIQCPPRGWDVQGVGVGTAPRGEWNTNKQPAGGYDLQMRSNELSIEGKCPMKCRRDFVLQGS